MNDWFKWRRYAWISTVIPAIIIILWPEYRIVNLIAVVWIGVVGYYDVQAHRKQYINQVNQTIESNQRHWINVMNHHRHDWMNDLQILFGYVKLGKQQLIAEYVERIKDKMLAESQISKLKDPNLISYLYGYRSIPSSFQLEIEFNNESDRESIHIDDEHIGQLIIDMISKYRLYASKEITEEQLLTLIFMQNKDGLFVHFEFKGQLINEEIWTNTVNEQLETQSALKLIGALNPYQLIIQIT